MNATRAIDLEDTEGLLSADRDGLLRAASSAGAQVRAIATAVEEGALEPLRVEDRPRSVIWVAGRGTAETAGVMLSATLGEWPRSRSRWPARRRRGWARSTCWSSPATTPATRRSSPPPRPGCAAARVVVVAPYEGPLRDSTAGRAAVLAPRLWVPDEFGLCRYLAAGLAVVHAVDPRPSVDLGLLADELDAEALRNSAGRELFTNPAKLLAARIADRQVALAGDSAATLALARHGSSVLLRVANQVTPATGLPDAVVAMRAAVPRALRIRTPRCSTTSRSTGRCHPGCGCWRWCWPPSRRWWPPARPGSTTCTCWPPRMCPTAPAARPAPACHPHSAGPGGPSSSWRCWPSGWRWPPFTCDWCGDR